MKYLPPIYVEPILVILSITTTIISLVQPQAELDKMERMYNDRESSIVRTPWDLENYLGQKDYWINDMWTNVQVILRLIAFPTMLLATIVWSAYSDKTGRQQPMLIAIFSLVWSVLGWMLVLSPSVDWSLWNKIPFTVVDSLTGGIGLLIVAAYTFMADVIKNKETLTVRLNILSVVMPISFLALRIPTTSIMDSLSPISFSRSMLIVLVLCILAFGYILIRIPQIAPIHLTLNEQSHPTSSSSDLENQQNSQSDSDSTSCNVFTPFAMFRDTWRASVKRRDGHVRLLVWLMCLLSFITSFTPTALQGGDDLFYDWTIGYPHEWTQDDLTRYANIGVVIATCGTVVGIVVAKKLLHLCDTTVMLISLASTVIAHIFPIIARHYGDNNLIVYGINIAAVFSGMQIPTGFAYLAKLVPKQELGRIFMLLTIFAVLGGFVNPFVMKPIYINSFYSFPSLIWILAVVLYIICFIIMLAVHLLSKRAKLEQNLPALSDTRDGLISIAL